MMRVFILSENRQTQYIQQKNRTNKYIGLLSVVTILCNYGVAHAEDSLEQKIKEAEALVEQKQHDLDMVADSQTENTQITDSVNTGQIDTSDSSSLSQDMPSQGNAIEPNNNQANQQPLQQEISSQIETTENVAEQGVEAEFEKPKPPPKTPEQLLAKVAPPYDFSTDNPTEFMQKVNSAKWYKGMRINPHTTLRIQVLLDWNHSSPGPIDTGWGMNSRKAIRAFEKKHGLKVDGKMDSKVWQLLNQGKNSELPALVKYTITKKDVRTRFRKTPKGYEAKAKDWELSYNNIYEMFGERFHMSQGLLKQINKGIKFRKGQTITVVNVGRHNKRPVDSVVVDKRMNILYAYNGDTVVATYPTTIGNRTPKSGKTYSMVGKVYMPTYKAETKEKRYILPPGPNNPVGVAWMALSKPTFGIHGSPKPEGISRQRSHGCVRLTNWDAAELFATIKKGARVRFK